MQSSCTTLYNYQWASGIHFVMQFHPIPEAKSRNILVLKTYNEFQSSKLIMAINEMRIQTYSIYKKKCHIDEAYAFEANRIMVHASCFFFVVVVLFYASHKPNSKIFGDCEIETRNL